MAIAILGRYPRRRDDGSLTVARLRRGVFQSFSSARDSHEEIPGSFARLRPPRRPSENHPSRPLETRIHFFSKIASVSSLCFIAPFATRTLRHVFPAPSGIPEARDSIADLGPGETRDPGRKERPRRVLGDATGSRGSMRLLLAYRSNRTNSPALPLPLPPVLTPDGTKTHPSSDNGEPYDCTYRASAILT